MHSATWLRRVGALGMVSAALAAGPALRADDEKPKDEKPPQTQDAPDGDARREAEQKRREDFRHDRLRQAERALEVLRERLGESKYRLGVQVEPVDPALDEQLQLAGQGVVVEDVAPDGPAAKASLKAHDIVLSVDDKPVKGPGDLAEIVSNSEGKQLTVTAMRAGKKLTVVVTPEKRGEGDLSIRLKDIPELGKVEARIREELRRAGVDNLRVQMFHPGEVSSWRFPSGPGLGPLQADFPDDLAVTIRKQGKNPPEIEVKKGDQSWTVKTNELAKLPEDVRRTVETFIGHGSLPLRASVWASQPRRPRPGDPGAGPPDDDGPGDGPRRPRRPDGPPDDDGPRRRRPDGPPHPDGPGPGPPGPGAVPPRGRDGGPPPDRRPGPPPEHGAGPEGPGGPPRGEVILSRLGRQMDEMRRQLDQMHAQLETLRRLPPPRPPRDDVDDAPGDF